MTQLNFPCTTLLITALALLPTPITSSKFTPPPPPTSPSSYFKNPFHSRHVTTHYLHLTTPYPQKIFYSHWRNTQGLKNAPVIFVNPGGPGMITQLMATMCGGP